MKQVKDQTAQRAIDSLGLPKLRRANEAQARQDKLSPAEIVEQQQKRAELKFRVFGR